MSSSEAPRSLDDWAEDLSSDFSFAVANMHNETELREHVHARILGAMMELYDLDALASAGEMNTSARGRKRSPLDRLYGGVAVEWEWNMGSESKREHGADQALNYLANIREHHPSTDAYTAVVSDGKTWGFLRYDPAEQEQDLFENAEPETRAAHFQWVDHSPAAVRRFLELIGSHKKSPLTGRALTTRFGPDSEIARQLVALLQQSLAGRVSGDRSDTLYLEWRRALDVVYGDLDRTDSKLATSVQEAYKTPEVRPLGELIFVLHTYFALVGRLLAVELLAVATRDDAGSPSRWRALSDGELLTHLQDLERGALPGDLQITNLFEADVFSWWSAHANSNSDLLQALRILLARIDELAFPRLAFGPQKGSDVLRDLYQTIVPPALRKALGEFLTPHWLAEACLARAIKVGADVSSGRVLDPTCGTGTFVVPIVAERLGKLSRQSTDPTADEVQAVLDSVHAIDLNPVAVTATRVNYTLALGELALLGPLTLPVWRADSIIVPTPAIHEEIEGPITGIRHARLRTSLDEPLPIPGSMQTSQQIVKLRSLIEQALLPGSDVGYSDGEVAAALSVFDQRFRDEFGPATPTAIAEEYDLESEALVASQLFTILLDLSIAGRDGIWARIIENQFAPLFAGKFDLVIGNPPWLTWTRLPEGWRSQTESLWRRAGLWYTPAEARESFTAQSTDIATLVFAVAILRYAKPDAHVALLTPSALISADPGNRAFRQFRLRPDKRDKAQDIEMTDTSFRALWVDDWSEVHPFAPQAANNPIFLVVRVGAAQTYPVPGAVWRRAPKERLNPNSWTETRKSLIERLGDFQPVAPALVTSAWRFQGAGQPSLIAGGANTYTFGVGVHTRGANGLYFVKADRFKAANGTTKATLRVTNITAEGRNPAIKEATGIVEADLVFPLVRGRDVSRWLVRPSGYFVLPHDPNNLDKPLAISEMLSTFPQALAWLSRNKPALRARKQPPGPKWDMSDFGNDWYRVEGPVHRMLTGHIVVVREMGKRPAAAVVTPRAIAELGHRIAPPVIDHKLIFTAVSSREEALYLAAFINSTPIQDLLESFVNQVAVSPAAMRRLPIPDFDTDGAITKEIVKAASAIVGATDVEAEAAKQQVTIDRLVLELINAAPDYKPQLARPRRKSATTPQSQPELDFGSLGTTD